MSKKLKITAAMLIVVLSGISAVLIQKNARHQLPESSLPEIDIGLIYPLNITSSDMPSTADNGYPDGFQRDFRIHLQAGKILMFEGAVGWQNFSTTLYDEERNQLGEMNCGYNARCRFFAEIAKDGWGILRIKGVDIQEGERASLEIRPVIGSYSLGTPTSKIGILKPTTIHDISLDILYNGKMENSAPPVFWSGEGALKDYRVNLPEGKIVQIVASSEDIDLATIVYSETGKRLSFGYNRENSNTSCVNFKAPKDGAYTLRIRMRESKHHGTASASFTLKISELATNDQPTYSVHCSREAT